MEIKGDRITIRPIRLEDAYAMKGWGFHRNTLLADYNIPELTNEELKQWFKYKSKGFSQKYYSVENEVNILIGYFGIKNVRRILREATLGIAIDPNYVNMGYGSEIIRSYLNYFFNEMKMKTMYLEVAKFNTRAIKCYEKVGFFIINEYLEKFYNQNLSLKDSYYLGAKDAFLIEDGKIYNYIYMMKIDKETFNEKGE